MKKLVFLISLALVLGLVLIGCPQPNDGGETPIFVAVTGIASVPTAGIVDEAITLTGTVEPATATNKAIEWSTATENVTITEGKLTSTVAQKVVVTATIIDGTAVDIDYTQTVTIEVIVFEDLVETGVGTMKAIPGGTFTMGNADPKVGLIHERPISRVTVSSFYLAETEVTQGQWLAMMESNPSYNKTDLNLPVEMVSWYDAIEFCNKLSANEDLSAYYKIDKTNKDHNNTASSDSLKWTVTINEGADGYRLPTEAEWEYAAGGGKDDRTIYAGTDDKGNLGDFAWYNNNANGKTYIVGTTGRANGLGLYDMSGNVYEWCWDWYHNYNASAKTNPTGLVFGSRRILRGGGYAHNDQFVRVASRNLAEPTTRVIYVGFRVARSVGN